MTTRRGFLSMLGLGGAAAALTAGSSAVAAPPKTAQMPEGTVYDSITDPGHTHSFRTDDWRPVYITSTTAYRNLEPPYERMGRAGRRLVE